MCSEYDSCYNCTYLSSFRNQAQTDCIWCATQSKCLLRSTVKIYYPFGECLNYVQDKNECDHHSSHPENVQLLRNPFIQPSSSSPVFSSSLYSSSALAMSTNSYCTSQYTNCSACIRDERCGWCTRDTLNYSSKLNSVNSSIMFNYSLNTGFGSCMEGGETAVSSNLRCKFNWYFSRCPTCECNGHSVCSSELALENRIGEDATGLNATNPADLLLNNPNFMSSLALAASGGCGACLNNTEGDYCSECKRGFFGNPKNNGTCSKCDCGYQADQCDTFSGRCLW
jgi:hypothetical protein